MLVNKQDIDKVNQTARKLKAIVIGDTMLDRYIYGVVERISPEAPVPVLTHRSTVLKAGGAANVALNLAAWGCKTMLIGMKGNDENGRSLENVLDRHGIGHCLITDPTRPTTVKTRVVASSHHLLRIDEETASDLVDAAEEHAVQKAIDCLGQNQADLIIMQDYNKGFLTRPMIQAIIESGLQKKAFLAADPKEDHFFDYHELNLFKPNLREASHADKNLLGPDDLSSLGARWREKMKIETIAITLGAHGIFIQNADGELSLRPEREIDVVDVCGAGDAVACSLALSLLSGLDLKKSASMANLTGAFVCSHSGVIAAHPEELINWI